MKASPFLINGGSGWGKCRAKRSNLFVEASAGGWMCHPGVCKGFPDFLFLTAFHEKSQVMLRLTVLILWVFTWAAWISYASAPGERTQPQELKKFIEATAFIKGLSKQIPVGTQKTDLEAYDKILEFMHADYNIMRNRETLESIANSAPWSIEETNKLLLKAIRGNLSETDKTTIKQIVEYVRPNLKQSIRYYENEAQQLDHIIFKLHRLRNYHPLMVHYTKNYVAFREKYGTDIVDAAHFYLMYTERDKILRLMLKETLTDEEKKLLNEAINYPLNPNYWSELSVEKKLSREAKLDGIYKRFVGNIDYPFCFTAEEILKFKIAVGCTHAAISFMALAKALGYNDVWLVSAIDNYAYNTKYCKNGKNSVPILSDYIDSHKAVMVRVSDRYGVINTTRYPIEIIFEDASGRPFSPQNVVGKDLKFPSLQDIPGGSFSLLRVRTIGKDNEDYLHNYSNDNDVRNLMAGRYDSSDFNCREYPLPVFVD